MVGCYGRRARNPSVGFIEKAAEVLGVSAAELLGERPGRGRARPRPVSVLDAKIELVKKLPRKEQEFVLKFLDTVLERAQKAS